MWEIMDEKFNLNEMQKCALIYRDTTARFIYVCHHCGSMFIEVNAILRHIESHFEVVNVMVDQMTEDVKEIKSEEESFDVPTDHLKVELLDNSDDLPTHMPISEVDTQMSGRRRINSVISQRAKGDVKVNGSDVRHDIRGHIRRLHVYKMFPPPLKPKEEFICDICGATCKAKYSLVKHLQIHTNTKSHACTFCGKTFRLKSDVTIHERVHRDEKPYQCHVCGKSFRCNTALKTHERKHENKTYPCQNCGKIFRHPANHRAHMETHRVERRFKCTLCAKTFTTRTYLGRHMETHTDRKHPCRYCSSEFNTGDGLRQHYRHKHKDEWEALHPKNVSS